MGHSEALWVGAIVACATAGLAFALYWSTAPPDLTWAHHGADGGDLLAAAVSGGVPHPPGYPLYTLILQAWLWAGRLVAPGVSPARMGNLLSATLAAASVCVTVLVAGRLLENERARWWLAGSAGLLWAVTPLLWSQSLITEVYTLHVLLAAILVCVVLYRPGWLLLTGVLAGLGMANHLTFALLLPAVGYLLWRRQGRALFGWRAVYAAASAVSVAVMLYLRIPFAATGGGGPPPVNWGYADNWRGFWWLVSGTAYRSYLVERTWADTGLRMAALARSLAMQYTPLGLAAAAVGLAYWDRHRPELRTFSLLWVVPVSLYAILYATRDAQVYLLPVVWLIAVWIAIGLSVFVEWLTARTAVSYERLVAAVGALTIAGAVSLAVIRYSQISLRIDDDASRFIATVAQAVDAGSIVVSSGDTTTFALWYGAWGSGALLREKPGLVIVNDSLYQFDWYRRLQGELHPQVPGIDVSFAELLRQNADRVPIYFVEPLDTLAANQLKDAGGIWRYEP